MTRLKPWAFVVTFGVVSLLADMVYEGARSIIGPYLATLGASAALVGVVAGVGEFIGYGLRVVSGSVVHRTQRYWLWTITGYALTVLSVPLIGVTGAIAPALVLYGGERLGKAVRAPAKDTLLSFASAATGRGRAFGVHQAMDQTGALLGPLLLAAVLAWHHDDYRLAFGVLLVPGVAVLAVLAWLRVRVPDPRVYEPSLPTGSAPTLRGSLPGRFWTYAGLVGLLSCGVASFPLIAFHAHHEHLMADSLVPVLFAVAMAVDGASGLVVGRLYDAYGARVLLVAPVAAAVAALAFSSHAWLLWVGVGIWGVVNGVLDSTVKAAVTELVPTTSRALAFGWLSLVRGGGLLVAGAVLGLAYDAGVSVVVWVILGANAVALLGLSGVLRQAGAQQTP